MNSYIITFKPETTDSDIKKAKDDIIKKGGSIEHEYSIIKGFSALIPDSPTVQALESHPHIESVEKDSIVRTQ